ncbi:zygote arrest protein 1-like isoform X1 [Rhinatrema bivittatum]|uniref:zygote arrest protein 1-like isoform X1 n=1 Tax=Rhinatrema bivittatum TaxID=194408 RepID=UPI00112DC884|nr:zygote arrest protein 1-like isoform X1 [Rhinatrema bivittatum]
MEGFTASPYSLYPSYGGPNQRHYYPKPRQQQQQQSWRQSKGGPYDSCTEPADYLDQYKRAQLKAILSQVNPNLTPRLQKANTREVGVQVNPRVDVSVQCSLGARTLSWPSPRDACPQPVSAPGSPGKPRPAAAALGSPGAGAGVRFTSPIAAFSPMSDRQILSLPPGRKRGPLVVVPPQGKGAQEQASAPEKGPEARGEAGVAPAAEKLEEAPEHQEQAAAPQEGAKSSKRSTFQFLEQKYGYFHCKDCKSRWESAYVWCISGTSKVYFKQLCRRCQKMYNPYRVEAIQCQTCSKTRCTCPQKKRHIDLKRPHRQELCGRCKDKKLSCDNTYSFKYIM